MIMGQAVPLRLRGLGDCLSVSIPGIGTSSDCSQTDGSTGGYYVDSSGNIVTYDASGNVVKTASPFAQAAQGQTFGSTGQPTGGATGQTSPSLSTTPGGTPGPGLGLCNKMFGTGVWQSVVCTPWFLVACVVVGGVLVFKVLK